MCSFGAYNTSLLLGVEVCELHHSLWTQWLHQRKWEKDQLDESLSLVKNAWDDGSPKEMRSGKQMYRGVLSEKRRDRRLVSLAHDGDMEQRLGCFDGDVACGSAWHCTRGFQLLTAAASCIWNRLWPSYLEIWPACFISLVFQERNPYSGDFGTCTLSGWQLPSTREHLLVGWRVHPCGCVPLNPQSSSCF